jgi:hypothetical protein
MIINRKNYPSSTKRELTLEDYSQKFRGRQTETIVDNIDKFDDDLERLNNNICFLETCKAEATVKPYRIDNISHNILTFHLGNNEVNSSCQKFVKNITIKGLKKYNNIEISIGGQPIYRMYDFMYDVISTRYNYKDKTDKDTIIIPFDIIPLLVYHNLDILIYTSDLETKDVQVEYNVFVYDMVKDPINIIETAVLEKKKLLSRDEYMKNNRLLDYYGTDEINKMYDSYVADFEKEHNVFYQDNLLRMIRWECAYEQAQYLNYLDCVKIINCAEKKTHQWQLGLHHPVNCIVMNVPINTDIDISFNKLNKIKLKPTYTVNEFTVYEIPYINFSAVDRADMFINDTSVLNKSSMNKNNTFELIIYAFNVQLLRVMGGMAGTAYG